MKFCLKASTVGLSGGLIALMGWGLLLSCCADGQAQNDPITLRLPASTVAWVRFREVQDWSPAYERSAIRRLVEAGPMAEFRGELERILQGDSEVQRVAAAWKDLQEYAEGDVILSWTINDAGEFSTLLAIEIADPNEMDAVRQDVVKRFERREFNASTTTAGDLKIDVFHPQDDQGDRYSTNVDRWFVLADDLEAIQALGADQDQALVASPPFRRVADATFEAKSPEQESRIRIDWFLRPWQLADAWRDADQQKQVQRARQTGFLAMNGAGGKIVFPENATYASYQMAFSHEEPLELAARMLSFSAQPLARLPSWIGDKTAYIRLVHLDLNSALSGYGSWFDSSIGENNEGLFENVLKDMREDPKGPQVDFRTEVLAYLTGPVFAVDTNAPGGDGIRRVYAIETRRTQKLAEAVAKIMADDPDVKRVRLSGSTGWVVQDLSRNGSRQVVGPDLTGLTVCVSQGFLFASREQAAVASAVVGVNLRRSSTQTFNRMFDQSRYWGVKNPFLVHVARDLRRFAPFYERLRTAEKLKSTEADGVVAAIMGPIWERADESPEFTQTRMKLPAAETISHLFRGDVQVGDQKANVWVLNGKFDAAQ